MKKKLIYGLLIFVAVTTGALGVSYGSGAQDRLNNVNNQISETKSKLKEGKAVENKLNREISALENQINQTQREIEALGGNIAATQQKITEALEQLSQVQNEMNIQNDQLNKRLRTMYKNGGVGVMDVILNSDSVIDFMNNMEMIRRIYESDKQVLTAMEEQHRKIEEQRSYLLGLQARLEAEQLTEATKKQDLKNSQSQVAEKKSQVATNNKALQEQLDAFYAEANRLTLEIKSLQGNAAYSGGVMMWPVNGKITSPFGSRTNPITKRKEIHTGIDIAAKTGTSVLAANSGVVIRSGWNNSYGNVVMIDHGGSIVTVYAHNSELLVAKGAVVAKGQVISKVGSTGMSTGPHLHFEVRVNGQYKNPRDWL